MEGVAVLIVIVLLVLLIAPLITAATTKSMIHDLSRRMDALEYKIDKLIENEKPIAEPKAETKKSHVEPPHVYNFKPKVEVVPEIKPEPLIELSVTETFTEKITESFTETIVEQVIPPPPTPEVKETMDETEVKSFPEPEPYQPPVYHNTESWWDRFNARNPDLEKFVGENLISKIGIGILVLGIAFFVKYAIDKDWINEYARVGIGMLAGGIVLGFAHRLRQQFSAFSSILVGGAIAIFYFTITIGFQDYHIFSQTVAFAIMIGITAFSVFISLAYNRQELAVLSLIGGFAAPFMVSTGDGNYKVLFSYLLLLDLGMLFISFMRSWKLIYILSYAFTIIIFGAWYYDKVNNASDLYAGAFIFASLFYVTFFMMGIINNVRDKKTFKAADITMILIVNSLFCGVGLNVFSNYHPELKGTFIICLAAFNFINSWILYRRFSADKTLVYLLIGLTLTYATLAAPVQLHGNYITLFWAAEAVLLMWLAQRSELKIFRFSSVIVHLLMFISLAVDWQQNYFTVNDDVLSILLNKGFITSMICLASLVLQIFLLRNEDIEVKFADFNFNSKFYRTILIVMALIVSYLSGFLELNYQANHRLNYTTLNHILIAAYHLVFSLFLILIVLKMNIERLNFFAIVLQVVNIALLIFNFADLPFELLRNFFIKNTSLQPGLLFHYIALVAFIYAAYKVFVFILQTFISYNLKFMYWMASFLVIYILSGELILHLAVFAFHPVSAIDELSITAIAQYEMFQTQVLKIGFPILWGTIAFLFLTIGISKQIKELRVISLVLLALTLVKLFVYDIKDVSEAGKIIAFILLGILLLIMSFMYQKIKAIILDDEK